MAAQTVRDWRRAARSKVHGYPEIKQTTKDATNSDKWGPTDAAKSEIAEASFNEENRTIVLKALWKRVDDKTEYWMHVYKALDVLEYLLLVDVPGIFNDIRFHHQQITQLQQYSCSKHKEQREQEKLNEKVRVKASRLLTLMGDGDLLIAERQKLRLIMARITGVSEQQLEGGGGGTATSGSSSSSVKPHESSHARKNVTSATVGATSANSGTQQSQASPPPPPGDDFQLDMDILGQLMDMGFTDQDAVVTAMMAADNNLERSVQYILSSPSGGAAPGGTPGGPPDVSANATSAATTDGSRGLTDLFSPVVAGTPPSIPPLPANDGRGNNGSVVQKQPVVDIFGTITSSVTAPAPAGHHDTGLWKPEEEKKPVAVVQPTTPGMGFDPFAAPAPAPAPVNTKPTAMPDFFAHNTTPQEVTKRGMTPPPPTSTADLFGPGPVQATQQAPPQVAQPVDLFGGPPTPSAPPVTQHGDLFGTPAPAMMMMTPQAQTHPTTTTMAAAPKKELTKQELMMQEFNMMGKPQQKAPPKPMGGQQNASLDQLMMGGQSYK